MDPRGAGIIRGIVGPWLGAILAACQPVTGPAPESAPVEVPTPAEPVPSAASTQALAEPEPTPRVDPPPSAEPGWPGQEVEQALPEPQARAHEDDEDPRGFTPVDVDTVAHGDRIGLPPERGAGLGLAALTTHDVYWATQLGDRLVLSTIHFTDAEFDALVADADAAEADGRIPAPVADHPKLQTFSAGESMTVVAPGFNARHRLESFMVERGAWEGSLDATFEAIARRPKSALVLRTDRVHAKASLSRVRTRRAEASRLDEVRAAVGSDPLTSSLRRRHVREASIRASVAGSRLVVLDYDLQVLDPDADYAGHLSGLFVLEPGGAVHPIARPTRRLHTVEPLYRVDLDGDQIDEIVFHTDDGHSGYTYLSVWTGDAYTNLRLTGSGG